MPSCFAKEKGWQFTATTSSNLRRHKELHDRFAASRQHLLEVAEKVTRTDDGSFICSCGFRAKLGKIVKHKCLKEPLRALKKRAKKTQFRKRKYRSASSFSKALENPDKSRSLIPPETGDTREDILQACLHAQTCLGAPFLRLLTPGSDAGWAPPVQHGHRDLRVGDFIRAGRGDGFWCVKKLHLKQRMQVWKFAPKACKIHAGTCWRVARRHGKPETVSMRRPQVQKGGPWLYPRTNAKSTSLASRCYTTENIARPTDNPVQSPLPETCGKHDKMSEQIFREVATLLLDYQTLPEGCPQRHPEDDAPCQICRRGCRLSCRVVTSQGVFLARRQTYSCSRHGRGARWSFPLGDFVSTQQATGHILQGCLVDHSFWQRAWRLFQETEDWCSLERDLRATTADRMSWALTQRQDVQKLEPAAKAALHESLLQVTWSASLKQERNTYEELDIHFSRSTKLMTHPSVEGR